MRYLLAFLLALGQDCDGVPRDHTQDSTDDLVIALEHAETELVAARNESRETWLMLNDTYAWSSTLESENSALIAEMERDGRARILTKLERILLQRYIEPVDRWMENPYAAKHPFPRPQHGACWYALVIEAENPLVSQRVWVKFNIDVGPLVGHSSWDDATIDNIIQHHYKFLLRDGILDTLERQLVLCIDDADITPTIVSGTPHLYELASKEMDVEKLDKKSRIY